MTPIAKQFRDFLSSVISFPADYFAGWFGVAPSESGVEVNELTAMQIAAYVGCVRLLSDAIAMLPLNVYERISATEERLAIEHPLQNVLCFQTNPESTAADVRQTGQAHCLMTGNTYLEIAFNGAGQPAALFPRSPFATFPYRNVDQKPDRLELMPGELFYKTTDTPGHYERAIRKENMVHVKGLGMDSLVGLSPVKYYAREVLGTDLAAQSYSAKFFANDSRPGGYLSVPGIRSPEQKLQDVKSWMSAHGRGQASTMAVMDGGVKWESVGVPPEEAQFLQTREFNRTQIACIFGVPPHFLGEAAESRANMEQRALEFLTFTLRPWINKWEQALNSKMFPTYGRNANRFFCRFDTSQFERATYADLLKGIQMGRYSGLITIHEGRKALGYQPYSREQLNSKDPGDKLWVPVNMAWVTDKWDEEQPTTIDQPGGGQGGDDQDGGDGGSKPPSGTTQGGDRELQRYFLLFAPTFRDAFGRILARSKADRRDFERTFLPILRTIAATYELAPDREPGQQELSADTESYLRRYTAAMHSRSKPWNRDLADQQAGYELKRALLVLRDKCLPAPPAEETPAEDEQ
jgi:HK97 family phage portal protein